MIRKLLTRATSNAKTAKQGEAFEAVILHLAPDTTGDGKRSVCPWSTAGCRAACLNTAGRSQFRGTLIPGELPGMIHSARRRRTLLFLDHRAEFLAQLHAELTQLEKRAAKAGKQAVARLNGTSDIAWEKIDPTLFTLHPTVQFYDYTKAPMRALEWGQKWFPPNYHLTYSRSEETADESVTLMLKRGVGVAVVVESIDAYERFANRVLPPSVKVPLLIVDGTAHDWRFTDPRGALVMLLPKGRAKHDATGFVVREVK